jgi:hypothetical protein
MAWCNHDWRMLLLNERLVSNFYLGNFILRGRSTQNDDGNQAEKWSMGGSTMLNGKHLV